MRERPFIVNFGTDRYYQLQEMVGWCFTHIGPGGWKDLHPDNFVWSVSMMFGEGRWVFTNLEDFNKFEARWKHVGSNREDRDMLNAQGTKGN